MRAAVAAVLLIGGCTWSNSLYRARSLAQDANRAEREHRPGEAQTLWGQVEVKAESAYARSPRGSRGAEALWLAGHAAARTNDCARAVREFQGALFTGVNAPWRSEMLLELGQCEEAAGMPTAAAVYAMLAATGDSSQRRLARIREGHVLLAQGSWAAALSVLEPSDSQPVRLDRALALSQLGRDQEALVELTPAIASGDTTVRWSRYLEAFAATSTVAADTLLARLVANVAATPETQSSWWLAASRGAMQFDPAAARRRLLVLSARPRGPAVIEGGSLRMELQLRATASIAALRVTLDSLQRMTLPEGTASAIRVGELERYAGWLVARDDSTRAGVRHGDLAVFALAEFARDSLEAPLLGASLFARIERDWPASPYVAKAALARAALQPDSSEAIIARVRARSDNPFVRAAAGNVAAQVRVAQLEDSLGRFVRDLWSRMPAGAAVQAP